MKFQKNLDLRYERKTGYRRSVLKVIEEGKNVVIYCKATRVFVTSQHQYNCTSTFYDAVTASNFDEATKAFERLKRNYPEYSYAEVGR